MVWISLSSSGRRSLYFSTISATTSSPRATHSFRLFSAYCKYSSCGWRGMVLLSDARLLWTDRWQGREMTYTADSEDTTFLQFQSQWNDCKQTRLWEDHVANVQKSCISHTYCRSQKTRSRLCTSIHMGLSLLYRNGYKQTRLSEDSMKKPTNT